jgi:hypothetical protein
MPSEEHQQRSFEQLNLHFSLPFPLLFAPNWAVLQLKWHLPPCVPHFHPSQRNFETTSLARHLV